MKLLHTLRSAYDKGREIWADRDEYRDAISSALKEAPGRFRAAPPQQKKAIVAVVITILGLQAALLISLL